MVASLKWRPCSRAISRTMSTIQASPASEPDVPAEPIISGIPALMARIIMISVSRLTAAAENMQVPVASGPGPGSVLPASRPIIRAPSEIALFSDSARNPEPSMPVAETSGNDAMAKLLDAIAGEDIVCRTVRKPMDARWYLKLVIDAQVGSSPVGPGCADDDRVRRAARACRGALPVAALPTGRRSRATLLVAQPELADRPALCRRRAGPAWEDRRGARSACRAQANGREPGIFRKRVSAELARSG